jgi:hypothetical protein
VAVELIPELLPVIDTTCLAKGTVVYCLPLKFHNQVDVGKTVKMIEHIDIKIRNAPRKVVGINKNSVKKIYAICTERIW